MNAQSHSCCINVSRRLALLVVLSVLISGFVGDALPVSPASGLATGSTVVFAPGGMGYDNFRIPAIVRVEHVLVAFTEARRHIEDHGHIDLLAKRSDDGGRTWSSSVLVAGNPSGADETVNGNMVPIVDADGVLHVVFCINNTWVFHTTSNDTGQTWSHPRNISAMVRSPGWGWMATGPNHGLQLRSGRLIVPFNTFPAETKLVMEARQTHCAALGECAYYQNADGRGTMSLSFRVLNAANPSEPAVVGTLSNQFFAPPQYCLAGDRSAIMYSDDKGETWRVGAQLFNVPGSSECVAEEVDGELLLSFRVEDGDNSTGCRHMARSRDGGLTFYEVYEPEVPENIGGPKRACIPDPVCQGSLLSLGAGEAVLSSGPTFGARQNLTVHLSLDGARKFQHLLQANIGPAGYSDLVQVGETPNSWSVGVLFESGPPYQLVFAPFDVPKRSALAGLGFV